MARPRRSRCGCAPTVTATGSNDAGSDDCREESRPLPSALLNANPGNCCEEPPLLVPENNPIRIATAQTDAAVIHATRTATRPVNRAPDVPFTMTGVWSRNRILGPGDWCPREGQMPTPQKAPLQERRYSGGTSVGIFICRAASFEKVRSGSVPLRRAPIFASVPTR